MSEAGGRPALPRELGELGVGVLFDAVLDAIVISRGDGAIAFWNPAAERILGYSAEEARGMNVDQLVPAEFLERHHAGIARYRETGHGRIIDSGKPIEVPALRKDGERVWVDLTLSRVDHEGEPFAIAILRDVTERVRTRVRSDKAARELQDAYASLEAFSGVVAHDLKEPVRAMGVYLEEMQEEADEVERAALVRRALVAHHNLQRLLDGLLEWSRTIATPLAPRDLDLRTVLTDAGNAAQWEGLLRERHATLQIAEDVPMIRGTESLVVRVFGNLVTNAIRHNPKPDPKVTIRAEPARRGVVRIMVEDDGPGFTPDALRAMRAGSPRSVKRGFGLAIARRAAERLGGRLHVENRAEGGGRVVVELPAAKRPSRSRLEERVRELV